jgi:hypothetical protein
MRRRANPKFADYIVFTYAKMLKIENPYSTPKCIEAVQLPKRALVK